jgi:threonine dehydrogenase-like Zn-dependent dehydrogenase
VSAEIVKITGGGADVALDTTTNPAVVKAAVRSLAPLGTCGFVSGNGEIVLPRRTCSSRAAACAA